MPRQNFFHDWRRRAGTVALALVGAFGLAHSVSAQSPPLRWQYSYRGVGGIVHPIPAPPDRSFIEFPSIELGLESSVTLIAKNKSGSAATFTGIRPPPPFSVPELPEMKQVNADDAIEFGVIFTPTSVGRNQAQALSLNGEITIALQGVGRVKSGTLTLEITGSRAPLEQFQLGIAARPPISKAITGKVIISSPDPITRMGAPTAFTLAPDQALTLGVIPVGTVAGTIQIELADIMVVGDPSMDDITPTEPPEAMIEVPETVPNVHDLRFDGATQSLVVTGYSTIRAVDSVSIFVKPKPGRQVSPNVTTIDVRRVFDEYFQSWGLRVGGQFQLSVPLRIDGDRDSIDSISVSLANRLGPSTEKSLTLPR